MKKLFITLLAAAGISAAFAANAYAEADVITVKVDNVTVEFDQNPIIVGEGYTMVPVRAVFEQAGADVSWESDTQTAIIEDKDYTVTIKYGDNALYKNGEKIELESPAIMENNRILIPVRAIAEAMDFAVTWDGHHSMVLVSTDGKPYRPYAFMKTGFKTLKDAAELYLEGTGAEGEYDLDGDGTVESVAFNAADEMTAAGVLTINGMDYTAQLGSLTSAYATAVVDLASSDNRKEVLVIENGDTLTAHFYHYESGIFKAIKDGDGNEAEIVFAQNILFSGEGSQTDQSKGEQRGYILSDLHGVCFVDIMVTGGLYCYDYNKDSSGAILYDEPIMTLQAMTTISPIFGRNLYRTYDDSMMYNIIYTDKYTAGSYKEYNDTGIIGADSLEHFKLLDGYYDSKGDREYIELYIELPDGTKAVIKPYQA